MTDLFTVTAPLVIRFKDGRKQIMISTSAYREGLVFLAPFWHEQNEEDQLRYLAGPIKGEGPWKVGDAVVTVLGCHGTDAELANQFAEWQSYLQQYPAQQPDEETISRLIVNLTTPPRQVN